jgi:CPA2 family monovalent cation:H+ antiporter-2
VGYLLAGVIIGPFTPGFVADAEIAAQLAEIGVILLMFGVGLHFSLKDLLAVRRSRSPAHSPRSPSRRCSAAGLALARLEHSRHSSSGSRSPSPAPSCCCARSGSRHISRPFIGRIAVGWLSSRTSPWCWRWS